MISVTVKTLDSQNHAFEVEEDISVKQFKEIISPTIGIPVDQQRLIFRGRALQDDKPISEYEIGGNVVHVVKRPPNQNTPANDQQPPLRATSQPSVRMGPNGLTISADGVDGEGGGSSIIMHFTSTTIDFENGPEDGQNSRSAEAQVRLMVGNHLLSRSSSTLLQQMEGSGNEANGGVTAANAETAQSSPSSVPGPPGVSSRCAASFGNVSPSSSTSTIERGLSDIIINNPNRAPPSSTGQPPMHSRLRTTRDEVDIDELLQMPPSMVQTPLPQSEGTPAPARAPNSPQGLGSPSPLESVISLMRNLSSVPPSMLQTQVLSPQRTPAPGPNSQQRSPNPLDSMTSLIRNLPSDWENNIIKDLQCQKDMPAQPSFSPGYTKLFQKMH